MTTTRMKKIAAAPVTALCILSLGLSGCAATGEGFAPHVDRPGPNYNADLQACQAVAGQREIVNGDSVMDTGLGAAGGTAIGAIASGWSGAWIGALIGTGVGATAGIFSAKDDQKNIVIKCMKGRGYNVLDVTR